MQDKIPELAYLHNPRVKETWADPGADAKTGLKISEKKNNGLAIS